MDVRGCSAMTFAVPPFFVRNDSVIPSGAPGCAQESLVKSFPLEEKEGHADLCHVSAVHR